MGVRDDELAPRAGWPLGLNNLAGETALPVTESGAPAAVREADNVDFDVAGKAHRRDGYTLAVPGTRVHSAWGDATWPWGLFVSGDTLTALHPDERTEPVIDGLTPGWPVAFERLNDSVLWSNGVQCGVLGLDLDAMPWACPTPESSPRIAIEAGGALDAGRYQLAMTFLDARGRESGASNPVAFLVPANSMLRLSQLPQPLDVLRVPRVRVYLSSGLDGVFRVAATLPVGVTDLTLTEPASGRALETLNLRPLPAGQGVCIHNGRQFVARGAEVWFSPPLRYGLTHPGRDRVGFAGRVDLLAPVADGSDGAGLFVADAKRTYFLAGPSPAEWRQVIAYPVGAIPGALIRLSGEVWNLPTKAPLPVWIARNGRVCVGLPGGQVITPQPREGSPDAVLDAASRGALLYREHGGKQQLITTLRDAQPQSLSVRDRAIARVYRHDDP